MDASNRTPALAAAALLLLGACVESTEARPPVAASRALAAASASQVFGPPAAVDQHADPERNRKIQAAFGAIDVAAEEQLRAKALPGLVIGLVVDGTLVYSKGFGVTDEISGRRPDADTVYRVGSVTKSFTALDVLALRDEGKLSLDEPLTRLVPEAAGFVYPTRDSAPITLRELLTHTSGLPRVGSYPFTRTDSAPSEREMMASFKGFALENVPGTTFVYSNLGYALLGVAAGRAAGTSYRALTTQRLLKPLGMTSSGFDKSDIDASRLATAYQRLPNGKHKKVQTLLFGSGEAAGGMYSTVRDLSRYAAFQMAAYPPRDTAEDGPVRRASVREAHLEALTRGLQVRAHEVAKGEPVVDARSKGYGYAWFVNQTCELSNMVWHTGTTEGYSSIVAFMPDRGIGVVALTNLVEAELNLLAEQVFLAIQKTGGLGARPHTIHASPALTAAADGVMRAYEHFDEGAFRELVGPHRARAALQADGEELLAYRAVHGACGPHRLVEVSTPYRARYAAQCEHGTFELTVAIDPREGRVAGFSGVSKGIPLPARVEPAARAVASLIGKWDDALYQKHLAPRAVRPQAETAAAYDRFRETHGSCRTTTADRDAHGDYVVRLACDRGGDLRVVLRVADQTPDVVEHIHIAPVEAPGQTCPVR